MGSFLTSEQLDRLVDAETLDPWPIPTQMISNGEFWPVPQTAAQKLVEQRLGELADRLARPWNLDRRSFLKTSAGMAAAFLAMNQVYGSVFNVREAEASDLDAAEARADELASQFIFDAQTHFVKDSTQEGTNPYRMLGLRRMAAMYLNPELRSHDHAIDDIKFQNFVKEVYLDSDTKLAVLSGAPSDKFENWFLSNDQIAQARDTVNEAAGSRRLFSHSVVTPGHDGWLEDMQRAADELKPDSWKGYTMGDPNGPSVHRWRLDDEQLMYPAYEIMEKSGITTFCLHKGLLPPNAEAQMPGVTPYAGVDDVPKAAKDWPGIDFIIYHCAYNVLMPSTQANERLEESGYVEWVSDLAEIPEKYGVNNVYAEIGSSFGLATVMLPRFCAGMMGALLEGMGPEKVFWGTDSVWYGSPQWQLEAFRRMEIPEDLQQKFGYAPLGDADGPVKRAILGENLARYYGVDVTQAKKIYESDDLSRYKLKYAEAGEDRSNLAYGFVNGQI